MDPELDARITAEILRQAEGCAPGKSVSPEDVAKALAEDWHGVLARVRRVAVAMAGAGQIEILRKGKPVPVDQVRGVIRLRAVTREPGV
jgi:hypothetical protein